jgi:hypothetical protein
MPVMNATADLTSRAMRPRATTAIRLDTPRLSGKATATARAAMAKVPTIIGQTPKSWRPGSHGWVRIETKRPPWNNGRPRITMKARSSTVTDALRTAASKKTVCAIRSPPIDQLAGMNPLSTTICRPAGEKRNSMNPFANPRGSPLVRL